MKYSLNLFINRHTFNTHAIRNRVSDGFYLIRSSHFANCPGARIFTIKCENLSARAVRKHEVIKSIQFSTDFYLSQTNSAASWTIHEVPHCPGYSFHLDKHGARASSRHKSQQMSARILRCRLVDVGSLQERKSPFVPRDVNNYSCKRVGRFTSTTVANVAKAAVPQRDGLPRARNARRSYQSSMAMGRDWLSRLLSVTGTLISVALINQLTLTSLYDSLIACRYSSLIVYMF